MHITLRKRSKIVALNEYCSMTNRSAKMSRTTKEQMIKIATQVRFHDDEVKNMSSALEESIPERVEEVISATEEHTS
ncbi:hypothetical protein TNCV_1423511 [Trichonephila clavipes]|nr:hypothetical protein TNCV_1423511 [Trichonephila clavipes]